MTTTISGSTGVVADTLQSTGTGALTVPAGTTAQRPASPAVGMQRWNTTLGQMEAWTGSQWQPVTTLLYSGTYLIVAGGGGGGGGLQGGGGGAGGLLTGSTAFNAGTSYTITVGAGGADPVDRAEAAGGGAVRGLGGAVRVQEDA